MFSIKITAFRPVFLPIYSSNLDPEEQIWRVVRRPFKNKVFKEKRMRSAFKNTFSKINNLAGLLRDWIKDFIPTDAYPYTSSPAYYLHNPCLKYLANTILN